MKTKIALITGGYTGEAEVSFKSSAFVYSQLDHDKYDIYQITITQDAWFYVSDSGIKCPINKEDFTLLLNDSILKFDLAFIMVHGSPGEDGRLQSMLEAIKMPYTGSGVLASAVAMDKIATKRFLISANISTPKSLMYNKRFDKDAELIEKEIIATFGVPVVIKAADQGSSIGVEIVKSEADVKTALENVFKYSDLVLVEECINGKELTCGVMEVEGELKALPIVMIVPHSGSYDFESKYTKGATDYLVPAPLSEEVTAYVQGLAVETYKVLGLSGVARIDVMLDAENIGYVLEANTIPGMTATSLVPKEAAAIDIDFASLCEMILLSAK